MLPTANLVVMHREDVHRDLSSQLNIYVQMLALLGNTPLTLPPITLTFFEINIIG